MKDLYQKMEGKTNFSRRLKQFDDLTWLTLTPWFYDRPTPLFLASLPAFKRSVLHSLQCSRPSGRIITISFAVRADTSTR